MAIKFYDTNALLELQEEAFNEFFVCSEMTLRELEEIKTSNRKTEDVKYKARKLSHLLDDNFGKYYVVLCTIEDLDKYKNDHDTLIVSQACNFNEWLKDGFGIGIADGIKNLDDDMIFVTNDICCKNLARVSGLNVESTYSNDPKNEYDGFIEAYMTDEAMARFYENLDKNEYGLLCNQYIIIRNKDDEIVDVYRWTGEKHEPLYKKPIKSLYFEKLKSKDVYQQCAIDALMNCTITAISGKAGSGKSLLSLMCCFNLIETGKYDRLVVMFNPTKTRGATDLGYYSGSFEEKAMSNSIGNILTTKFGDRYAIDVLLQQGKIKLVSMADARGMEISDNEILWITEAQNTSIDLIKLCLSRVSSNAKVFIEGDYMSQVDSHAFEGENNGLKRVIDVFKGHEEFGYVKLQNIWRSKIAELCELL